MIRRPVLLLSTLLGFALAPGCESDGSATVAGQDITTAPRLRLRVSGNLEGYLMPCGCASGQLGGLARRMFRHKLDGRNIDLFLEGGNLIKHAGELDESKLMAVLEVLDNNGYHGIGIGSKDLSLDTELLGSLLGFYPKLPALAADLMLANGKPWQMAGKTVVHAFREHTLPHVKVRFTSLTMKLPEGAAAQKFMLLDPARAWTLAMQGVEDATYRVLMIHAEGEVIRKLKLLPKPDLIIAVNHDYVEPKSRADQANGVPMVYAGTHGRVMLDLTLARGADGPVLTRIRPVPLKGSITAPQAMRDKDAAAVILAHRQAVKEDGLLQRLAQVKPLPDGLQYVGPKACAECHEDEDEACLGHAHSHAWKTLIEAEKREGWPVTHYPECVSCHVVGYGEKSGFLSPTKTPEMLNVTCESCHGPGSKHVATEGDTATWKVEVETCTICHNFEHSPKFDYSSFWKEIEHGGK